jgi:hypothetical protein
VKFAAPPKKSEQTRQRMLDAARFATGADFTIDGGMSI